MKRGLIFGGIVLVILAVLLVIFLIPKDYTDSVGMNLVMKGCIEREITKGLELDDTPYLEDSSDYEDQNVYGEYDFNPDYKNIEINESDIIVSYNISHLCGSEIEVEKEIKEGRIDIITNVSGGNRCGGCNSEINVELEDLPSGDYIVELKLITNYGEGSFIFSKEIKMI